MDSAGIRPPPGCKRPVAVGIASRSLTDPFPREITIARCLESPFKLLETRISGTWFRALLSRLPLGHRRSKLQVNHRIGRMAHQCRQETSRVQSHETADDGNRSRANEEDHALPDSVCLEHLLQDEERRAYEYRPVGADPWEMYYKNQKHCASEEEFFNHGGAQGGHHAHDARHHQRVPDPKNAGQVR